MPGSTKRVADNASDDEWHAAWARTLTINLQAAADLCRLAVSHFRDRGGGGRIVNVASRAAFRGDSARSTGIMRRPRRRWSAMTKTIARGYAADGILAFAVAPGFTVSEMTEEYLAGRGGAKIVADIPLGRVASTDEIAETIRWLAIDAPASATGSGHRRQRRQLCSLACASLRRGRADPADRHPARQARARSSGRSRADRNAGPALGARLQGLGRLGQAGAAGPDPRQHLSGRHLRHLRDPDHRQGRPCADRRRHREGADLIADNIRSARLQARDIRFCCTAMSISTMSAAWRGCSS